MLIMVVASALGLIFAEKLIMFFRDDPEVISIGTTALRLQSISLVLMPVSLCGNMLFQSVGKGGIGTLMASIRSGLVFIPIIYVMSRCFGVLGIQLSQPLADIIASAVTVPFMVGFFKKLPYDKENL
jgi:Na+-driven multidrug efflux pump